MNDANNSIKKLIKYFEGNECLLPTNKQQNLDAARRLRQCASEIGLSSTQILSLANVAAAQKFGDNMCNQLIHALIPREGVPENAALLIISKICHNVQSLKTKNLLIRWLVLVFDLIATKSKLHCLYGILFRYIESDLLCPSICHLLFLLTKKKDVSHYRISKLLEIQQKLGSSPHITGLLSVYKMYYPSLISMYGGYRTFFKKTDRAWEQSIKRVQQRYGFNLISEAVNHAAFDNLLLNNTKQAPLFSASKLSMVHDTETLNQQPLSNILSDRVPVYQIKSFQELLDNFSRLDLSCQAFTLLHSITLQHAVVITPDRTVAIRLSFWLHHHLNKELVGISGETERGKELLKVVLQFCGLAQECLPVCDSFLFRYLFTWNGQDYRSAILKLVTKLGIMPYEDLYNRILQPLAKLYKFSPSVYFKCSLINTLSELLSNYLSLEASRLELRAECDDDVEQRRYTICPRRIELLDISSTLTQFIRFVDGMFTEDVGDEEHRLLLLHYMLQFHKKVSGSNKLLNRPLLILPSHQIMVEALFSLSAPCIDSLCSIFLNHMETVTVLSEHELSGSESEAFVDTLKQYMEDIFDTLWRRNAFFPSCNENSFFFQNVNTSFLVQLLSNPEELPPNRMFCLDRHPALLMYSALYIEALDKELESTVEAKFVKENNFMEFLQSKGLENIVGLIENLRGVS